MDIGEILTIHSLIFVVKGFLLHANDNFAFLCTNLKQSFGINYWKVCMGSGATCELSNGV